MAWLKDNNTNLIRIKEEIDKVALKKIYSNGIDQVTGELVPGMEFQETISYNIRIKE